MPKMERRVGVSGVQEMLWAFQSIHRRFATSLESIEPIPAELLQQYKQVGQAANAIH